jgi:hypothetical protein
MDRSPGFILNKVWLNDVPNVVLVQVLHVVQKHAPTFHDFPRLHKLAGGPLNDARGAGGSSPIGCGPRSCRLLENTAATT